MYKRATLILLAFIGVVLGGCNKELTFEENLFGQKNPAFTEPRETYHVFVNAINDGEARANVTYRLLPGLQGVDENGLLYREYAGYVHRALEKSGYKKAKEGEKADIGILFAYGIGEPNKTTSYTTTGVGTAIPSYYSYTAVATSTTTAKTLVTYTRNLVLDAYDYRYFRKTGKERQVWLTKAISTGSRSDMRQILPVLVTTIAPYMDSNTGKSVKLVVNTPSVELYEIMGKPIPADR